MHAYVRLAPSRAQNGDVGRAQVMVGRDIELEWLDSSGQDTRYLGTVSAYDQPTSLHTITYADGSSNQYDLAVAHHFVSEDSSAGPPDGRGCDRLEVERLKPVDPRGTRRNVGLFIEVGHEVVDVSGVAVWHRRLGTIVDYRPSKDLHLVLYGSSNADAGNRSDRVWLDLKATIHTTFTVQGSVLRLIAAPPPRGPVSSSPKVVQKKERRLPIFFKSSNSILVEWSPVATAALPPPPARSVHALIHAQDQAGIDRLDPRDLRGLRVEVLWTDEHGGSAAHKGTVVDYDPTSRCVMQQRMPTWGHVVVHTREREEQPV